MVNFNTDKSFVSAGKLDRTERLILTGVAGTLALATDIATRGILNAIPDQQPVYVPPQETTVAIQPSAEVLTHITGIPVEEQAAMQVEAEAGAKQDMATQEHADLANVARSGIDEALRGVDNVQIP
jgi:hypothetical protein